MSNITIPCDNCERDYNPTASRWKCPYCGFKTSCCEGDSGDTGCHICGEDCVGGCKFV